MNTKVKKSLFRITLFTFAIATFVWFGAVFFAPNSAAAENSSNNVNTELFLPKTEFETFPLNAPTEVYSDDSVTAIIQNGNSELIINYNGTTTTINGNKILDVDRFDDNSIIFSSDSKLYKITLNDQSTYVIDDNVNKINLNDKNGESVSYFDVNNDYLVTAYQTYMQVYAIDNGTFNEITDSQINIVDGRNVAINGDTVYFVSSINNSICSLNCSSLLSVPSTIITTNPEKIVANENYVYYIYSNFVYRVPIGGGQEELKFEENNPFDLGAVSTPKSISLKGDNVYVIEGDTIQEFKIDGNNLVFTGYAIANGKTAYNRISQSATRVEKYGDTVAVLDGNKITVVNTDIADQYDRNNFTKIDVNNVEKIALGNRKILTANSSTPLQIIDLDDSTLNKNFDAPNNVKDICYQSGKFYLLICTSAQSFTVYSINENDQNYTLNLVKDGLSSEYNDLTVDVFGNLLFCDGNNVYKHLKSDNYQAPDAPFATANGIIKMATDLSGTLYLLDNDGIKYFDNGLKLITVNSPINQKIKAFAIDVISDKAFALYENSEYLCSLDGLENITLSDADLSDGLTLTAQSTEFENLKIYAPKDGANVYSITTSDNSFVFNGLVDERNQYVYLRDVVLTNSFTSIKLCALTGKTETVLINFEDLFQINLEPSSSVPQSAFTTTGVNFYYLPIITKNSDFALSNSQGVIRLNKATQIFPEQRFTFLDNEFYFASAVIDGNTIKGYVPTKFTVEILSENFKWDEYSYQTVKSTTLFKNADLTEEIALLEDGQTIKLMSIENGVACVAVDISGEWIIGYIDADRIKDESFVGARNALVIIAVAACVCGTTAYFVYKKKND